MNDPREVPHLRWRSDGIGNIRIYHSSCPKGRNISDPAEYNKLMAEGWCHRPENVPTLAENVVESQEPIEPELVMHVPIDDFETRFDEKAVVKPEPEEPPKPKKTKKSGNNFAR